MGLHQHSSKMPRIELVFLLHLCPAREPSACLSTFWPWNERSVWPFFPSGSSLKIWTTLSMPRTPKIPWEGQEIAWRQGWQFGKWLVNSPVCFESYGFRVTFVKRKVMAAFEERKWNIQTRDFRYLFFRCSVVVTETLNVPELANNCASPTLSESRTLLDWTFSITNAEPFLEVISRCHY